MATYKLPQAFTFLLIAFIIASLPQSAVPARCLPAVGAAVLPSLLLPGVPYYMRPVNLFPPEANTNGFAPQPHGVDWDCKYYIAAASSNTSMVPVTFSTLTGEPFVVDDFFYINFNVTLDGGTVDTTWGQGPSSGRPDLCVGGKSSAGYAPTLFKMTSLGDVYSLRADLLPFPDLIFQKLYLYMRFDAWHSSFVLALGPDQIRSHFRFFKVEDSCDHDLGTKSVV